ncbi:hypothetical protein [Halorientalis salina]|uniref:hypothetical protein n=1 Tax=Halorientalis salina TaxID=2932266 RepID=UPI0010AD65EF|nr:hypothetical protein [Halorientalis salina]
MQELKFIEQNAQGVDEIRISDVKGIEAPFYTPEVSGPEGLQALLHVQDTLESKNPIIVPGHRWQDIRSKPRFKKVRDDIRQLVTEHPFYYYEPVELFRYTRPQNLVTYAFQGDQGRSGTFYDDLRDGNYEKAIERLPRFFQPFVQAQMKTLLKSKGLKVPMKYQSQSSGKVHEAWRDNRADSGFTGYFERLANDAANAPNAALIPPVPPVMKSSGKDAISRSLGLNSYMRQLAETKHNEPSSGFVTSYLHFYIDQGIFEPSNNDNDHLVKQAIRKEVENASYSGIAITISNIERVWEKGHDKSLERFITDVSNIARQEHLPVILPRSGYYGMHLTDYGVQTFSTLMNGNLTYNRRGGGIDKMSQYGTLPIYGSARDVNAEELDRVLSRNGGEVHDIAGLPNSPPTYNESASSYKAKYGKPNQFRLQFGKPRRMVHIKEAQELRDGIKRGTAQPARRYLERADHPVLS